MPNATYSIAHHRMGLACACLAVCEHTGIVPVKRRLQYVTAKRRKYLQPKSTHRQ